MARQDYIDDNCYLQHNIINMYMVAISFSSEYKICT